MLHGAMAELQSGDAAQRESTAQTVSRIFLRGDTPRGGPSSRDER
jgi:glutamyl-tRNA reductase